MLNDSRIDKWHKVVAEKDFELLNEILDDNVVFHSPTVWEPKPGKQVTAFILKTVIGIFEDFTYHREFQSEDDFALEFSANVGDKKIKGIDLIHWNEAGKIDHFEVAIRPINGLQQLFYQMTEELKQAGLIPS